MIQLTLLSTFFYVFLSSCSKEDDPLSPPTAPSDFIGTTISGSEIRLDWTDNPDNEEGFVFL